MEQKKKIDFIGLGAAKSGTTWITDCLREHPDVGYPKINELNYFSRTRANNTKSEYEISGIKGYLDIFNDLKGKVKGEFSTHYLPDQEAGKIIKKHFPEVKLLVSLRDPVDRAYSDYLNYKLLSLDEKDSFEVAFFKRRRSYYDNYMDKGFYYKQLIPYFSLFPRKNIKIILLDDIEKNPKKTIKEVFDFIGVDKNFVPSCVSKKSNVSSATKFKSVRYVANSVSNVAHKLEEKGFGELIHFLKRRMGFNKLYWYIVEKNRKSFEKEALNPETRKKLVKVYISDINKLGRLIRRDLSVWKK